MPARLIPRSMLEQKRGRFLVASVSRAAAVLVERQCRESSIRLLLPDETPVEKPVQWEYFVLPYLVDPVRNLARHAGFRLDLPCRAIEKEDGSPLSLSWSQTSLSREEAFMTLLALRYSARAFTAMLRRIIYAHEQKKTQFSLYEVLRYHKIFGSMSARPAPRESVDENLEDRMKIFSFLSGPGPGR